MHTMLSTSYANKIPNINFYLIKTKCASVTEVKQYPLVIISCKFFNNNMKYKILWNDIKEVLVRRGEHRIITRQ